MTYDFKDLSVMVADQTPYIARVTVSMLRVLEIRDIKTFSDIDEMLAGLLSGKADLIMTELDMEPVDGLTLIRKIRGSKHEQIRCLPLMVTAGFATKRLVGQARNAGADDFMVKPFSVNTLYTRLVKLTERRQPFVDTKTYFGPDRRRKDRGYGGPDRRAPAPDAGGEAADSENQDEAAAESAIEEEQPTEDTA